MAKVNNQLSCILPAHLDHAIRKAATRHGCTITEVVELAVELWVKAGCPSPESYEEKFDAKVQAIESTIDDLEPFQG